MRRRAVILWSLVLALLAALGYWIAHHVEKREITIPVGLHDEALRNPLLAAQRYLDRMGIAVERLEDARRMLSDPAVNDALVITSDRQTLGQTRTRALLEWVRRGGHLVVTVPRLPDSIEGETRVMPAPRDPLLAALGLGLARPRYGDAEGAERDDAAEDDTAVGSCPATEDSYTEVHLPSSGAVLRVNLNQSVVLTGAKDSDGVAWNAGGVALVSRALGRGRIVVLTDLGIFQYRAIGELDHALLLWHLVKGAGKVWLVSDNDMPPLWQWLWQHAMETVTAASLLLLLWLWSRAPRFGPPVEETAPARRRILEHIEAAGRFLWQHKKQERLLQSVRDALTADVARRHPAWTGMSDEEKIGHLASLSGRRAEEVRALLQGAGAHRRQDFFHVIRQLETIRKTL